MQVFMSPINIGIMKQIHFISDRANIPITEKVGCVRNITCDADINTFAGFYFSASEIVRPDGNTDNIAVSSILIMFQFQFH